jgi:glycosyltransferase involved in cell wall biosynthesis
LSAYELTGLERMMTDTSMATRQATTAAETPQAQVPTVVLATIFSQSFLGGVASHMRLLARGLGVPESEIVNYDHLLPTNKSLAVTAWWVVNRRFRQWMKMSSEPMLIRRLVPHLRAQVELRRPAIVHCHDPFAALAADRVRGRGRDFKIVVTHHGPASRHMREYGVASERQIRKAVELEHHAWRVADAVIGVDTTQAAIVLEQGAPPDRVTVIRNAVDLDELDGRAALVPLARRGDRPVVLVPRRLEPKNGVDHAIRAVGEFPATRRPRLVIAGTGAREQEYRRLAADLGVAGDVAFLGAVAHDVLIPLIAAADAVLIPSVPYAGVVEATSIAALEGMALARPVVASNIGGLAELLYDGESGLLVDPAAPAQIRDALERVFASPALAQRLGGRARDVVRERFSVAPWMACHHAVYGRVAEGVPVGPARDEPVTAVPALSAEAR